MEDDFLDPDVHQHKTSQSKKLNSRINNNSQQCSLVGSQQFICHDKMSPCKSNIREIMSFKPIDSSCNQMGSAFSLPFISKTLPRESTVQKRYLISDQSGNKINLLFYSVFSPTQNLNHIDGKQKHLLYSSFPLNPSTNGNQTDRSYKASAYGGTGDGIHEDTKEIDALLYSHTGDEEENVFNATSQIKLASNHEDAASYNVPRKRKRLDAEMDPSLIDTASSSLRSHFSESGDFSDRSSAKNGCFIQSVESERDVFSNNHNKMLKRHRVREAMCVLRKIVPGGKTKDTTALLDKAIWYLKSFKAQGSW